MKKIMVWLFAAVLLFGCGGGGGDESPNSASTSFQVVSVSPVDGATGVATNAIITATLNQDIDPVSINSSSFTVVRGIAVTGTVSAFGNAGVSFTPTSSFSGLSSVAVTLSGLKNKAGVTMETKVWAFTTGSAPDTTPPTVPTNLTATPVSQTQINLALTGSTDNTAVSVYKFFRNGTQVGTSVTVGFSDIGLTAATTYSYTASACDASGNCSAQTAAVSATTLAGPVVTTVTLTTANWVPWSAGGNAQATFDKTAGTVTENIVGNSTDVSVRWAPLAIDKTKIYHASFSCASVPQRNVEMQLKQDGGVFHPYSTISAPCTGTVSVNMPTPDSNDPLGRFNINFGAATGVYSLGAVTITYY